MASFSPHEQGSVRCSSAVSACIRGVVCLAILLLPGQTAFAEIEVRRSMDKPGELVLDFPPASFRRAIIAFTLPGDARISVLAGWNPPDAVMKASLLGDPAGRTLMASTRGSGSLVMGGMNDTDARQCSLILETSEAPSETIQLSLQLHWSVRAPRRVEERPPVPAQIAPGETSVLPRILSVSWREGALLPASAIMRDGLRMEFSAALNPGMAEAAIRLEAGFPGAQSGLIRYEEIECIVDSGPAWVSIRLPRNLVLPKRTPLRIELDGHRILSRDGLMFDADGTALMLPSGDGRPGGIFRSKLVLDTGR